MPQIHLGRPLVALGALFALLASSAAADPGPAPPAREYHVLQKLHTDAVATFLDSGVFTLGTKADVFEGLGMRFDPDTVWFHVDGASKLSVPAGWDFLAPAGSQVWIAPQSNPGSGQLWPGFSTESVPAGTIDGEQTTMRLVQAEGPGALELFTIGGLGERTRLWSSDESIGSFRIGRTHMHANWAFTQAGTYRLTVEASAVRAGQAVADTATYTFVVGALPPDVATTTTVAASATAITAGKPVTLTATVAPATVDGYAEFRDGTTVLGHAALHDGKATLEVSGLGLGTRSFTAVFVPKVANVADASTSAPVEVTVSEPGNVPFSVTGVEPYQVGDTLSAQVTGATLAEGQQFRWLVRPVASTATGTNRQTGESPTYSTKVDALWDGAEVSVAIRAGTTVVAQTPWVPIRVAQTGTRPSVTLAEHTPSPLLPGDPADFKVSGRALAEGETLQWGFLSGVSWIDIPRQLGGEWTFAFPDATTARLKYNNTWAGVYPLGFGARVLKDGVTLAVSPLTTLTIAQRELQAQGHRQLYREGGTVRMDATAYPVRESDRISYTWTFAKGAAAEAWGEGAALNKTGLTKAAHDGGTLTLTLNNHGEPAQRLSFPIKVTDDVSSQLLAFNTLAAHYHQGDNVRLQLTVDPAPVPGDTLDWEWKGPGGDAWAPLPGVVENVYAVAAEQGLDGVEIRAKLTFANGSAPAVSETRTIHVDDHGAAPRQKVTVTGETSYAAGAPARLTAEVAPPTVLATIQWQRKARGAADFTTIAGATGATYAFTATTLDDGAEYRAAVVKPGGEVAYGPSPAATLKVEAGDAPFGIAGVAASYGVGDTLSATVVGATLGAGQNYQWMVRRTGSARANYTLSSEQSAAGHLVQRLDAALDGYEISARLRTGTTVVAETPWVALKVARAAEPLTLTYTGTPMPAYVDQPITWAIGGRELAAGETVRLAFSASGGPWGPATNVAPVVRDGSTFAVLPFGGAAEYDFSLQVVRDGLVVAQSAPTTASWRQREALVEGVQGVYRPGNTLRAGATVHPSSDGLTYSWLLLRNDATGQTQTLQTGGTTLDQPAPTVPGSYRLSFVAQHKHADGRTIDAARRNITFHVSGADPSEQVLVFNSLSAHYHQGGTIKLQLVADPGLAAGDRLDWQWRWPGEETWRALPGATGLTHSVVAEQALDGVQVRAVLTFAGGGAPVVAAPVTILVDDHGAAPTQKVSVTGETAYRVGDAATLKAGVAPTTVLDRYQWFANGTAIPGATKAAYAFTAAPAHDGTEYTVAVVKPTGAVVYGPSAPVTVKVRPRTTAGDQPVGGTVPPVLALELGAVPSLGTFTPGTARTYAGATTATVTTTLRDARLIVADAGTSTPGHLVNGDSTLATPLHAAADGGAFAPLTAPVTLRTFARAVSGAPVAIAFEQAIGAREALEVGGYAKTLTFTLTTSTP